MIPTSSFGRSLCFDMQRAYNGVPASKRSSDVVNECVYVCVSA